MSLGGLDWEVPARLYLLVEPGRVPQRARVRCGVGEYCIFWGVFNGWRALKI
mgnify:CR=1 FL=1